MPPEVRLLGIGSFLPEEVVLNEALARQLGTSAAEIARATGIESRRRAAEGEGPSDLALRASQAALRAARTEVAELGLIVFATATPDVTFPGAACYLQHKLGAPTIGALDVRAQAAGFVCGLDLAASFAALQAPGGGDDPRYARILVAAGEVHSSGLDETPRGADLTPRFGDGAAVAIVGRGDSGPRLRAVRWYTEGEFADRFWCEYPASRQYPLRITPADLAAGRHFPRADLAALAPIARERLAQVVGEVLAECGWQASALDAAIVDFVDPAVARTAASDLGISGSHLEVPTAGFGHVMAGGLPIALARRLPELASGAKVLLAAAGPGFTYGAAALEV